MLNTSLKIKDLQQEREVWKKGLEAMLRENAILKNKLAELLRNNSAGDNDFLETAEQYQTLFLREDESINLIRRDVSDLDKWLIWETFEDGQIIKGAMFKQNKLRKDIQTAYEEFNKLKNLFNNYVSSREG